MKAAQIMQGGSPLQLIDASEPEIRQGAIKISVEQAMVPSFTGAVLSGRLPFPLPVPYIPGPSSVGIVEEIGEDVFGFEKGQRVLVGPHFRAGANGHSPEEILIGWFGLTPQSRPLMARWKNGSFAQKALYPAVCATPIDDIGADLAIRLSPLCIAYGALLRGELKPGGRILITGATGNLGSATALVALAMGAECIYAVGRNVDVLNRLSALDNRRIIPVPLEGDAETWDAQIASATSLVDVVIDALGYVDHPLLTQAAIRRLCPLGTAVFMGGVMTDIPFSYIQILSGQLTIRGSFMHPPTAASDLIRMVRGGLIDLEQIKTTVYPLTQINEAIAGAATQKGLSCCTVQP